jgi:hypothetical protein
LVKLVKLTKFELLSFDNYDSNMCDFAYIKEDRELAKYLPEDIRNICLSYMFTEINTSLYNTFINERHITNFAVYNSSIKNTRDPCDPNYYSIRYIQKTNGSLIYKRNIRRFCCQYGKRYKVCINCVNYLYCELCPIDHECKKNMNYVLFKQCCD